MIKSLKLSVICWFVFFLCYGANANDNFDAKIAIIDIEYILKNSLAIQLIRKDVERITKEIEQYIYEKEAELKKNEEALKKKHDSLKEKDFNAEVNLFNAKVSRVQQEIKDKKARLEQAYSKAMNKVYETTRDIVADLSKKKHFNLVIPSSQIFYAKVNFNITSEVIDKLNVKLPEVIVPYK